MGFNGAFPPGRARQSVPRRPPRACVLRSTVRLRGLLSSPFRPFAADGLPQLTHARNARPALQTAGCTAGQTPGLAFPVAALGAATPQLVAAPKQITQLRSGFTARGAHGNRARDGSQWRIWAPARCARCPLAEPCRKTSRGQDRGCATPRGWWIPPPAHLGGTTTAAVEFRAPRAVFPSYWCGCGCRCEAAATTNSPRWMPFRPFSRAASCWMRAAGPRKTITSRQSSWVRWACMVETISSV